jgi:hypothetical protein
MRVGGMGGVGRSKRRVSSDYGNKCRAWLHGLLVGLCCGPTGWAINASSTFNQLVFNCVRDEVATVKPSSFIVETYSAV